MDNLKLPAYPLPIALHNNGTLMTTFDVSKEDIGLNKIERASLEMAKGMLANSAYYQDLGYSEFSEIAVSFARAILEEANK